MIKLQTITGIELSNLCNLKCSYCINKDIVKSSVRDVGLMSDDTFNATTIILEQLVKRGTQQEIWMNGNGESLLDLQVVNRVQIVKRIVGNLQVGISTNGFLMSDEIAAGLKAAGIDRVDISSHVLDAAIQAQRICMKNGIKAGISTGVIFSNHNWAGQVDNLKPNPNLSNVTCKPLLEGRGYVQKEGSISPCCYDYRNLGAFGTVFDADILDRVIKPFELCETCHQQIPAIIKEYYKK